MQNGPIAGQVSESFQAVNTTIKVPIQECSREGPDPILSYAILTEDNELSSACLLVTLRVIKFTTMTVYVRPVQSVFVGFIIIFKIIGKV